MLHSQLTKNSIKKYILILRGLDEMRYPYETALSPLADKIEWFTSLVDLLNWKKKGDPSVVIVDLECLAEPLETQLDKLQTAFPASDLIALSGFDSAQIALRCIRLGFSEFLLNPISPEELAWSVQKCSQHQELVQKLDPKTDLIRTVTKISGCNSANLVMHGTLEFLRKYFKSAGAAWVVPEKQSHTVICSLPADLSSETILAQIPKRAARMKKQWIAYRRASDKSRKIIFYCKEPERGFLLIWGIGGPIHSSIRSYGEALVDHSEQCLLNLQKLHAIKQQTFVDDLTMLYNSRYLKYALTNSINLAQKKEESFSVLFIDIDHFKTVNDGKGHLVGSEFLIAIAKTIKNAVRSIDPVFRYGGDEFVVILQGTPLEEAKAIAERIRKNIQRRVFLVKQHRMNTTVSVGIATYPDHTTDREMLLKLADEAMYSAKKTSRNAVHLAYGISGPPEKLLKTG